jgi:hypothetical protein
MAEGYAKILVFKVLDLPGHPDLSDISDVSDAYTITLDGASTSALGSNPMNPDLRATVARAGYDQDVRLTVAVRAYWR